MGFRKFGGQISEPKSWQSSTPPDPLRRKKVGIKRGRDIEHHNRKNARDGSRPVWRLTTILSTSIVIGNPPKTISSRRDRLSSHLRPRSILYARGNTEKTGKNLIPRQGPNCLSSFLYLSNVCSLNLKFPCRNSKRKRDLLSKRKKELKERRSDQWTADESKAEEILLSGDLSKIEEFFLSHASLNPF